MGRTRESSMLYDGKQSTGTALLETDHIRFRGPVRLKVPFAQIEALEVRGDALVVTFGGRSAAFELGAREAQSWIGKIRNPPSLLDKLEVAPDDLVCVIGVRDEAFVEALRRRLGAPARTRCGKEMAKIFYAADSLTDLQRLARFRPALRENGAVWVVSRKGKAATIKDTDVMVAAARAGLVDTKVVAFSATHTALKLVIPLAARKARA